MTLLTRELWRTRDWSRSCPLHPKWWRLWRHRNCVSIISVEHTPLWYLCSLHTTVILTTVLSLPSLECRDTSCRPSTRSVRCWCSLMSRPLLIPLTMTYCCTFPAERWCSRDGAGLVQVLSGSAHTACENWERHLWAMVPEVRRAPGVDLGPGSFRHHRRDRPT